MKTTKQNSESKAQSRSEQASTEAQPRINFVRRQANRALDTEHLLALMRVEAPRFYAMAEIVGTWVWIRFDGKQPREVTNVLSELGFHWNKRRQLWQHPCGAQKVDPSAKYPRHFAATNNPA